MITNNIIYPFGFILFFFATILVAIFKKDNLFTEQMGMFSLVFLVVTVKLFFTIPPFGFLICKLTLLIYCIILARRWYIRAEDSWQEEQRKIGYNFVCINGFLILVFFISLFEKFL